jgi:hypothetical protein
MPRKFAKPLNQMAMIALHATMDTVYKTETVKQEIQHVRRLH